MVLFDSLSIRRKILLIILVALLPTASTTIYLVCANYKSSAALSLLALVLVIGFTRVLTRRYIVAPLEDMLNITRSVRSGDFTVRLNPRYPVDELGALTQSLNEMTAALEKRMSERDHTESRLRLSEENLLGILDSIEVGVIATDTVGRVTRINAVAEKLTGWSLVDASGRLLEEVFTIVNEESRQPVVNPVANVLENGEIVGLANHTILIARDGTERPIVDSGAPIKDRKNKMIGVVLVFRDQTEERAKERRMVQARDFYLTLFEEFPALIWRAGADGRRDYFNKTWLDFRGRTLEEESADGWVKGVHPEDVLHCLSTHLSAFDAREPFEMEYRLLHRDGEYRWIFDVGRPYKGLGGAFAGFIGSCFDITEKKRVSNALAKSEELLGKIFDATPDLIMVVDRECRIICSNWHSICSDVPAETREQGLHCHDILQEAEQCLPGECPHLQVFASGEPYVSIKDLPGLGYFEMRSYPVFDETGAVDLVVRTLRDITTQHKTEEQLRHLQKMEAISTLVGGIAHDFNNILTVIVGYGTLLMTKLAEDDPLRNDLTKILSATNKATSLTSGLLAYSRRVPMLFHPVDINDVIMNLDRFLSRIIGEDIELAITPSRGNLPVLADTGQIEQVVMNLAANSRDAMPNGGKIAIGLSEAHMDRVFINSHGYGAEGRYALINFSDNGVGMDKTTQQRIFEPFFTTKDVGKGTGLGLSIVYGIVKQHNGYINLYSEPGYGTRFRIYLPLTDMQKESTTVVEQTPVKGKGETILLIEDDDGLRSFARETLHCFDYRVLEAESGDRAMEIFLKYAGEIDLILSDIVMPHKSGRETMEEIRTLKEDVKILYMSGYTGDMIARRGIDTERMELLSKPFTPNALLAKVREILDGSGDNFSRGPHIAP